MAHGGPRVGAGRPKKSPAKPTDSFLATLSDEQKKMAREYKGDDTHGDNPPVDAVSGGDLQPLEYMLGVMNDPNADDGRRDRMAVAAAPYIHGKVDERLGKKEQRQEAADRANAKFAVPAPPRLVISNK